METIRPYFTNKMEVNNLTEIIPITVNEIGEDIILKEVDNIKHIFKDVYWYPSAGTALGLYRDGHLIPHDTDYDIEILLDNPNFDIEGLNDTLRRHGLKLIRMVTHEGRYMQLAYYMRCGFIFDIYFYYFDGQKYVNINDCGELVMFKDLMTSLEDYLEFRYGPTWRIPKDKKGNWSEDAGEALVRI